MSSEDLLSPSPHTPHYPRRQAYLAHYHQQQSQQQPHQRHDTPLSTFQQTRSAPWSTHDDEVLVQARTMNMAWAAIHEKHFPTKTANACRKRYERLMLRRRGNEWDEDRTARLAVAYKEMREEIWGPLAQKLGERWEHVEKTSMEKGLRNMLILASVHSRNTHDQLLRNSSSEEDKFFKHYTWEEDINAVRYRNKADRLLRNSPGKEDKSLKHRALEEDIGAASEEASSRRRPGHSDDRAISSLQQIPGPPLQQDSALTDMFPVVFKGEDCQEQRITFVEAAMAPTLSSADILQNAFEDLLGAPISWWPLKQPRKRCPPNHIRVTWTCTHQAVDLPILQTHTLYHPQKCLKPFEFDVLNNHFSSFRQWMSMICAPMDAPTLPTDSFSPYDANAAVRSPNPVTDNISTGASSSSARPPSLDATISQRPSRPTKSQQPTGEYLHWCVDPVRAGTKLVEFSLKSVGHLNLVQNLLTAYRTARGLPGWFSLTTCSGARLIKFKMIEPDHNIVACIARSIPCPTTNDNYSYSYQAPEPEFIRFVEELLAYRLQNQSCNCPSILNVFPKKIGGKLKQEFGEEGYGLHAISAWSLWKGFVAFLILSIPPSIFAVRWLVGHQGDLQNAFMLELLLIGVLNIFVVKVDSQLVGRK